MERDATHAMGGRPVLFVSYSGVLGGAERVLLDCATRLARPAVVACPDGPLAAAAREAGLSVETIDERPLQLRGAVGAATRGLARFSGDARRLVKQHDPAVVAAWGARAVLGVAAARTGSTPVLAVHHDLQPSPSVAAAVRTASRRAAGTIATSVAVARDLNISHDVVVLHPGVDLRALQPQPLPPAQPPSALVLGALVPWKRADLALEVAALIPELKLSVAGEPLPGSEAFAEGLRARAWREDLLGRVFFPGRVEDLPEAFAEAHLLLHCADAEPFGLALVEAMACGRPVVAAAAAGPLEIVTGGSGRLFAPGDAAAAAEALRAVLADPGAPAAARARAEAAFDVEASAERFSRAVESVAP
jgi:glycosyltransferase involved in cell wall biosynthesis